MDDSANICLATSNIYSLFAYMALNCAMRTHGSMAFGIYANLNGYCPDVLEKTSFMSATVSLLLC